MSPTKVTLVFGNEHSSFPISNLNLIFGRRVSDMTDVLRVLVPTKGRRVVLPVDMSPIARRVELAFSPRSEPVVFEDLQKSRTKVALLTFPETLLTPLAVRRLTEQLFYKAVRKGCAYFVLTHSEDVLSTVLSLVRNQQHNGYTPERVSLVMTGLTDDGAHVFGEHVRLMPSGDFASPWTNELFSRLREAAPPLAFDPKRL